MRRGQVERHKAHNLEIVGSIPTAATIRAFFGLLGFGLILYLLMELWGVLSGEKREGSL